MAYYYLVKDGKISGMSDNPDIDLPDESWSIVESEEPIPLTEAVLENGVVVRASIGPFGITEPIVSSSLNWAYLESQLRNSAVWAKAYSAAEKSVKANAAFTLVLTAISTIHSLDDLKFGWERLRSTMQTQASLDDFTIAELDYLSEALEESGFDLNDFDLSGGI